MKTNDKATPTPGAIIKKESLSFRFQAHHHHIYRADIFRYPTSNPYLIHPITMLGCAPGPARYCFPCRDWTLPRALVTG